MPAGIFSQPRTRFFMKTRLLPLSRPLTALFDSRGRHRASVLRLLGALGLGLALGGTARAQTILGSTGSYGVMAGSTVTNTGVTTINGSLGGANFAGPGTYSQTNGTQISPITTQNQTDFTRAFGGLAALTPTANLSGLVLGTSGGATTLAPGIYKFDTTAQLTGTLVLDAQNQANAVWVFQIGSTLTTAAGAAVTFINQAPNSVANNGLFWQIGSTTTVGANSSLQGNFLGGTTFSFDSGATIVAGRALTGTGTITMTNNTYDFISASSGYSGGLGFVDSGNTISAVPEPSTYALFAGLAALGAVIVRRRRRGRLEPASNLA